MNFQDELDFLFLGNAEFTAFATDSVDSELKKEIISKAFPTGSRWKLYTGIRSIAFFPLQSIKERYVIIYSIIIENINMPILSFGMIVGEYRSRLILSHRQRGIENSFLRKLGIFVNFNEQLADVLKENIVSYKSSATVKGDINVVRQTKGNQTLFVSSYTDPFQWTEIETLVIKSAFPNGKAKLSSFRSFTLGQEIDFDFLGLTQTQ